LPLCALRAEPRAALGADAVDLAAVVARALQGIGKKVIGGRDLLEALLMDPIARTHVGMQFLRQPAIGRFDFFHRRVPRHAEDDIRIPRHRRPVLWMAWAIGLAWLTL